MEKDYRKFGVEKNYPAGYLPTVPSFGENLQRIRKRSQLKAKDVAERLGVARSVVSGWENDRRGLPETPTLFKLAKALNCSIDELLRGVDSEYEAAAEKRRNKALDMLGAEPALDFDDRRSVERYSAAQELLEEARDAEERARIVSAIKLTLAHASDLLRHPDDQQSALPTGGATDVPASDSVGRLESLRERNRTLAGEVQDAIRHLVRIATELEQEAAADQTTATGGARRHRKTGGRRAV